MLQGVDINQIKEYNASLKQYRSKAASLTAEIEYTNKELDSLCAELTAELGVQVTRDNVESIYNEQVEKINTTLQSGNAVLSKIMSEENKGASVDTQQSVQQTAPVNIPQSLDSATPVNYQQVQPVGQPVPPVAPQVTAPVPPVAGPVTGSVFNGQDNVLPGQPQNPLQQPLFNLG